MKTDSSDDTTLYQTLRDGLIWGRWKSGEKLKPQHLKEELNCKSASLREALLRLAAEGFVDSELNQGFRTVSYSEKTFQEASHMRLLLECEAIQMAIKNGDFEWEMAVSAAHSKLAYVEKQMLEADDVATYLKHWSRQDWEFHSTIISACNSDLLLRNYKAAFDAFRMYAVSELSNFGFGGEATIDEHSEIFEAVINRDEGACIAAVERHLTLYEDRNRTSEPILPTKIQRS